MTSANPILIENVRGGEVESTHRRPVIRNRNGWMTGELRPRGAPFERVPHYA